MHILAQCPGSIVWNGGIPVAGTRTASGTILGTVNVAVSSAGTFATSRPGYANNGDTYNGYTWRSLMTYRGASFAAGTYTRFDLSVPVSANYIHLRVADIRGDGFNTEHQRVQAFYLGNPVALSFVDPVNGAFITGGNIINGASTTNATTQSSMRVFFGGPVDRIVVTATALSDYVIIDLFARCDILLPFELSRFEGKAMQQRVELDWTVSSESQVTAYSIERSPDGRNWAAIGQVPAAPDQGPSKSYRFTDTKPEDGMNFYRLKSIEAGGGFQYSRVIRVDPAVSSGQGMHVYPHPVDDRFNIDIPATAKGSFTASLYTAEGKLTWEVLLHRGNNRLSRGHLPKGIYMLRIRGTEGWSQTQKLIFR